MFVEVLRLIIIIKKKCEDGIASVGPCISEGASETEYVTRGILGANGDRETERQRDRGKEIERDGNRE